MERRLDAWDLLVIYLDGIRMGSHHVLAAVGVDSDGKKHVLGVREGQNAEVTALLEDLVERGLDPGRRRLFVIDGSKALRKAIEKVFGQRHPIQRCRNHKLRNVLGHLPKDQHAQMKAAFRAAIQLSPVRGLCEGLEMFTYRLPAAAIDQPSTAPTLQKEGDQLERLLGRLVLETEKRPEDLGSLDARREPLPEALTRRLSGATTFNCQRDTIAPASRSSSSCSSPSSLRPLRPSWLTESVG